ncbi:MAG: hypothetical protein GX256_06335 [Fretibacterium sp.]|nr:hypothetical protein [Fretibacterium sp.]
MADQRTWGEAIRVAWDNLTGVNNAPSVRGTRLLFFLLFLLGTAWALYSYYQLQLLRQEKFFEPSATPVNIQADKERLDAMIDQVKAASALRSNSFIWAQSMRDQGKYIFSAPLLQPSVSMDPEVPMPQVVVAPEPPPEIVVRATMIAGDRRSAVVDIAGVGSGMVMCQGDTFLNKKGRVVHIAADKVVVWWEGRNWDIAPGF